MRVGAGSLILRLMRGGVTLRRVRVLVVEDELKMAALVRRGLEREGYAVDVAADGDEALWAAREHDYDAIVLDAMIPEPDGFEVCRTPARPRAGGRRCSCSPPATRSRTGSRGLDAGADDYLTKPFAFEELFARLRALTRRGPVERPAVLAGRRPRARSRRATSCAAATTHRRCRPRSSPCSSS